jgi:hypothetical protein
MLDTIKVTTIRPLENIKVGSTIRLPLITAQLFVERGYALEFPGRRRKRRKAVVLSSELATV